MKKVSIERVLSGKDVKLEQNEGIIDSELMQTLCAEQVSNEMLDGSELLQSFCEEEKVKIESLVNNLDYVEKSGKRMSAENEIKKNLVEKYISDLEFHIRNVLKDNKMTVLLERGRTSELQDINMKLEKKLKVMEEKVRVLEKELEGSFDELENNGGLKRTEMKTEESKLEKELELRDESISNLINENESLKNTIDNLELEKIDNDIQKLQLENKLMECTDELENNQTETKENPEKSDKEVQTEAVEVPETCIEEVDKDKYATNEAVIELKTNLDEAYKIIIVQENTIASKVTEIELMSRKIKQWGLGDKLTSETKESTPRRKAACNLKEQTKTQKTDDEPKEFRPKRKDPNIFKEDSRTPKSANEPKEMTLKRKAHNKVKEESKTPKTEKKQNTKLKIDGKEFKTPQKVDKQKEFTLKSKTLKTEKKQNKKLKMDGQNYEVSNTSLNASMDYDEYDDTDPRHPTSSFNLRRKGRNHKGREKLRPMGPLEAYARESVADIIVNKGEDPGAVDVHYYFAIRNRGLKYGSRKQESPPVFRNQGPRVSSWKEYRSKYM